MVIAYLHRNQWKPELEEQIERRASCKSRGSGQQILHQNIFPRVKRTESEIGGQKDRERKERRKEKRTERWTERWT